MAKNQKYEFGNKFGVVVAAGTISGAPIVHGQLPGVALTDRDATTLESTCHFEGVYDFTVSGVDQVGNSAVASGDLLYYTAADAIKLSKKNTGVRFGYALGAVAAAGSGTIPVKIGY